MNRSALRDDPAFLFELHIRPYSDRSTIIVRAFERSGWMADSHTRIDVEVRQDGAVIFPRGSLWCGIPSHQSIDGIDAKACVLGLVSMRPGDTDSDYFDSYSADQLAWANEFGEALSWEREARYCDPETGSVKSAR